jgi:hypothetical protein
VTAPTTTIVRYPALDGRSFNYKTTEVVLTASEAWEGGVLAQPSALIVNGETLLFYAAKGGIGLAKSPDGASFTKVSGPVFAPDPSSWEEGAVPASPGVVLLDDGSLRMFYAIATGSSATVIGEASSADGITWTRLGSGPALAPSGGGASGPTPWDAVSVGSPFPELAVSAEGRAILRLFYGAVDASGNGTIALAARYGTDGPFSRAESPVFGTGTNLLPREPCVVSFPAVTFLYATQLSGSTASSSSTPAVAVGVAPATVVLPPPDPM